MENETETLKEKVVFEHSFLLPSDPLLLLPFTPSFLAYLTNVGCSGHRGTVHNLLKWVRKSMWGEKWGVLCYLLLDLQAEWVKDGGSWLWRWRWGTLSLGHRNHAVVCQAEHRGSFSLSVSVLQLFSPCTSHWFSTLCACLSSSACSPILTCRMSARGDSACHLPVYLKETWFNILMVELGIYRCLLIECELRLNSAAILGTQEFPPLWCKVAWSKYYWC